MIELRDVRKVFHAGTPGEFRAIDGITLTIAQPGVTVLTGPSGSGKTTLLSIIGCMIRPSSGRVHLSGREVTSLPERFLTAIRRRAFGFVFQQHNLIRGITAIENVMLPAYPLGEPYAQLRDRALQILHSLDLADKALARLEWLSG